MLATTIGCIEGTTSADGSLEMFLGVPYAAAPVGELRFARPRAMAPTDKLIDGTGFGEPCPQIGDSQDGELTDLMGDEDCLTLNIWRPADAHGTMPVMFYLHGGQFLNGSGSVSAIADEPELAQSAIVVTHNSRLGPLGYLAHPALSEEGADKSSGNWGLFDSLLALQWVNDNMDSLGGNPDHVLLFGQESGATAACALMVSPLAEGLFTAVALQSPGCSWYEQELRDKSDEHFSAEEQGELFAGTAGCSGASDVPACLRELSVAEVEAAMVSRRAFLGEGYAWGPIVDDALLPASPRELIHDGRFTPVPVIAGVVTDEGSPYISSLPVDTTSELKFLVSLAAYLREGGYDGETTELVNQYSSATYGTFDAALAAFYSDVATICPTRSLLRKLSLQTETHGYVYAWPGSDGMGDPSTGDELPYVFGTPSALEDPLDAEVSEAVRSGWVFTTLGWSAVDEFGTWPAWDEDDWMWFRGAPDLSTGPRDDACDLYDTIDWQTF